MACCAVRHLLEWYRDVSSSCGLQHVVCNMWTRIRPLLLILRGAGIFDIEDRTLEEVFGDQELGSDTPIRLWEDIDES